jgi:carboxypeptidase C (cathepsin A)
MWARGRRPRRHSNSMAKKGSVVAGYAIQYQDFQFVTVKGAGHMVPTFKPAFAQSMLTKFLANENF